MKHHKSTLNFVVTAKEVQTTFYFTFNPFDPASV